MVRLETIAVERRVIKLKRPFLQDMGSVGYGFIFVPILHACCKRAPNGGKNVYSLGPFLESSGTNDGTSGPVFLISPR